MEEPSPKIAMPGPISVADQALPETSMEQRQIQNPSALDTTKHRLQRTSTMAIVSGTQTGRTSSNSKQHKLLTNKISTMTLSQTSKGGGPAPQSVVSKSNQSRGHEPSSGGIVVGSGSRAAAYNAQSAGPKSIPKQSNVSKDKKVKLNLDLEGLTYAQEENSQALGVDQAQALS